MASRHEFLSSEWYTINGRGRVATVIWRGPSFDKSEVDPVEFFRHVRIAGVDYAVKAVESYAISMIRTGDPIGLLIDE